MSKRKVLKKCYLAETGTKEAKDYGPGMIVNYDGNPCAYLEPVGDSAAHQLWTEMFPDPPRNLPIGL